MTKIITTIIILLIGYLDCIAQLENDTIDLTGIDEKNTYKLNKVTIFASGKIIKTNGIGTTFITTNPTTVEWLKPGFKKDKIPVKSNDTIMYMEFYINKGFRDLYLTHQWAILHFNKEYNILVLDKIIPNYTRLRFKVYKWTKTEIILKDITEGMPRRVYYLTRSY